MIRKIAIVLLCLTFAVAGFVKIASAGWSEAVVKESERLKADAKEKKDMPASLPGIKEITGDELKKMIDGKKKLIIMDNRLKADYDKEHITGAVLLTVDELIKDPKLADKFSKNDTMVNY